ncbi:hypothetical protein KTJ87_00130 [Rhodobacteraceae bacterium ASV31]|nr:hypothetical protein [Anianabacter salinae]
MLATTATILAPVAATAHPGHLVEAAGHNHWLAGAAIAAAAAIALAAAIRRGSRSADAKSDAEDADAEAEDDTAPEDAHA